MTFASFVRIAAVAIATGLISSPSAHALSYTLTNGNSSVVIKANAGLSEPDFGMSEWTVDCVDQLYKQWFWYRTGSTGPEKTISDLTLISSHQLSPNYLTTVYRKTGKFSIGVNYTLMGGLSGSGSSTIGEQISITNLSGSPLDFHFFQYVDFDLGGSNAGDTIELGQDFSGLFDSAYQNKGTAYFADEMVTPGATHGQAGLWPSIYNSLTDGGPTTLTDVSGPVTGDATWAFQWDVTIPVNGTFNISLNKSVFVTAVPEPSVLAVSGLAMAILAGVRRRNSSK